MFAFSSSLWLTCGVTKDCLLKHPTAVEGIKMTKPCKILFNKTRFSYKLDNLLFQITHIMSTINSLMFGSRICYFSDTFCKLCNMQQHSHNFLSWKWRRSAWYVIIIAFDVGRTQPKLNAGHKDLAERISILGWFNYWKYVIASTGKVREHLEGSECAQMFFLPWAALLIFYQSINQLYISTVVIKAEKLMGLSRKKKEEIQNYYNIIIIVQ